ncbi:MAG: galactose mutarotase [Tannerella sp.]|jgi:aldose 1-epimerase|nr:galactose mutarotase [Tannerella sp.]
MKNEQTLSGLKISDFQKVVDGKEVSLYVLTNDSGMEVAITNYGAKIVSLVVPDQNGNPTDIVLGHASIDDYLTSEERYFGAICGRYGNRIAKGRFELDGVVYDKLATNNGPNSLHGGVKGFNSVVWDVVEVKDRSLKLKYVSVDGEEGFPGTLETTVTYKIGKDEEDEENFLCIVYEAVTDKPTVLNLTNHSYFNLSGAGDPYIGDHRLVIVADYYLPTDETAIPYGPKAPVKGTPMDFNFAGKIGEYIDADCEQLKFGHGYDHTYILKNSVADGNFGATVVCHSPKTDIFMKVITSEPGVQLYTGNWMTGNLVGKNGKRYPRRSAFCIETQHFPDSPNRPEYPSTVLRPDEKFFSFTSFKFPIADKPKK